MENFPTPYVRGCRDMEPKLVLINICGIKDALAIYRLLSRMARDNDALLNDEGGL